jgi:hypothetical protein
MEKNRSISPCGWAMNWFTPLIGGAMTSLRNTIVLWSLFWLAGCAHYAPPKEMALEERGQEVGLEFLASEHREEVGYGLYSYILLGSPSNPINSARYRTFIEACLTTIPSVKQFEKSYALSELHIAYVPVRAYPSLHLLRSSGEQPAQLASWIFENYDFERARVLLRELHGSYGKGPFIISVLEPVKVSGDDGTKNGRYLFQDLSLVPNDEIKAWVAAFVEEVKSPRFWDERYASRLESDLRQANEGLPNLTSHIAWHNCPTLPCQ